MTYKTKRVPNSQMTNIGYALSLLYFILCMIRVFKARSAVFLVDLGWLLSFTCYFSLKSSFFTVSLVFIYFFLLVRKFFFPKVFFQDFYRVAF